MAGREERQAMRRGDDERLALLFKRPPFSLLMIHNKLATVGRDNKAAAVSDFDDAAGWITTWGHER